MGTGVDSSALDGERLRRGELRRSRLRDRRPVSTRLTQRTNEEWIAALSSASPGSSSLVDELTAYIRRVLGSTLKNKALKSDDIEDLAQESILQLLRSLDSFRGDSAFSTWVAAVATRTAYTELRRRHARETNHAAYFQAQEDALAESTKSEGEDSDLVSKLYATIDDSLTEKQRIATLALLRGVPTIEIAEQLGSNQNAVYKLVHDARLRLRDALERRGVTAEALDQFAVQGGQQ